MKYLFCIYTDKNYLDHLDNFKKSTLYKQITEDDDFEIVEWNPEYHTDYKDLPSKTQQMMKWCSENKEYDYLIKCDDTIFDGRWEHYLDRITYKRTIKEFLNNLSYSWVWGSWIENSLVEDKMKKISEDSYIRKTGIFPNLFDFFPKNVVDRFHKIGNDVENLRKLEEKYHDLEEDYNNLKSECDSIREKFDKTVKWINREASKYPRQKNGLQYDWDLIRPGICAKVATLESELVEMGNRLDSHQVHKCEEELIEKLGIHDGKELELKYDGLKMLEDRWGIWIKRGNFSDDYRGINFLTALTRDGWKDFFSKHKNWKTEVPDFDLDFVNNDIQFYEGKFYVVSKKFSIFIGNQEKFASELSKKFPTEDFMVGYLFKQFYEENYSL